MKVLNKKTAKNLSKCVKGLLMNEKTIMLYLYYFVHDGETLSTKEIATDAAVGVRTVKLHSEVLEFHGVLKRGEAEGRTRARKVTLLPLTSSTLPSSKLPLLYNIIDFPSQKTYARVHAIESGSTYDKEGEVGKSRVGLNSEEQERLKKSAQHAVKMAVKSGELVRPEECSVCGKPGTPEAHHHQGYTEEHRLDVVWLCRSCHYRAGKMGRASKGKFSLYDILVDPDWKKASEILKKYFKRFEYDARMLVKGKFQPLVELISDDTIPFEEYCKWYKREKYSDKGFGYGLFLYPLMIEEFKDSFDREGKYLKTASRMATSESHQRGVKKTKEFLDNLEDE